MQWYPRATKSSRSGTDVTVVSSIHVYREGNCYSLAEFDIDDQRITSALISTSLRGNAHHPIVT